MAQPDGDAGEESEKDSPSTTVDGCGRYEIIEIPGVKSDTVVVDYKKSPPELIVHAEDWRLIKDDDPESPSHVLELPSNSNGIPKGMAEEIEQERKRNMEHNV